MKTLLNKNLVSNLIFRSKQINNQLMNGKTIDF